MTPTQDHSYVQHHHLVNQKDRDMEPVSKAVLQELTDTVERWGATAFHHHIVDLRQQVKTELTDELDRLIGRLDEATTEMGKLVGYLVDGPPNEIVTRLDNELKVLRLDYEGAVELRRHVGAEGLDQTAADVAENGPRQAAA